jgi:ABC-2 type transport system permease protein
VLLPFMLIAGLMAVMVLMVLIKIATEIGIRWLLAVIVGTYISAIYAYFKVTNPVQLVEEVMKHYPNVNQYFGYLDAPFSRYLPNHWVSEFLYWSVHGDAARALPHFFTLVVTLGALSIVAAFMARRYYYRSWLAASDARALVRERRTPFRLRLLEFGQMRLLRPKFDALVKRDFWLFLREPSQWLHLALMCLLLMIFVISLGQMQLKLAQPLLQSVAFLVVFLFNGFLIASVSLRFVFPAVSLEGDTFWAVRAAPVSLRRLYWYKFWVTFLLVGVVGELLAVTATVLLRNDPLLVALAAVCTGFVALALTSVNLGAGSYFASYREKNPIRVASSQGASMTFLLALVYLAMVVGVLVLPLTTYFRNLILHGVATTAWVYLPVAVIAVISTGLFLVSSRIGLAAIQRDF